MNKKYLAKNILWTTIIMVFLMMFMLSGCSTVAGVGQDIKSSAEWTKEKMSGK